MTKHFSLSIFIITISLFLAAGVTFAEEDVRVEAEATVEVTAETEDETAEEEEAASEEDESTETTEEETSTETDATEEEVAEEEAVSEEPENDREMNALRQRIQERLEMQAKQREILQQRKEAHEAALKERVTEKRNTMISARVALAKRVTIRLGNIHERLTGIIAKVTERAEILAESGADIEKTMDQLGTAQLHLDAAALSISELDAMIDAWVDVNASGESASIDAALAENKDSFKTLVEDARDSLRSGYKSIRDAIRILKSAAKEVPIEAEAEVETEAQVETE